MKRAPLGHRAPPSSAPIKPPMSAFLWLALLGMLLPASQSFAPTTTLTTRPQPTGTPFLAPRIALQKYGPKLSSVVPFNGGVCLASSSVDASDGFVEAQDLEALQALFSKYCDEEGLMTKASAMQIPAIADLFVSYLMLS